MITKLLLPVFSNDGMHLERNGVVEGEKTFKPSPDAVARCRIVTLEQVPAFTKFTLHGKLWEKRRGGQCRKIQRGRPSYEELDPSVEVLIFA